VCTVRSTPPPFRAPWSALASGARVTLEQAIAGGN
jgi:hypothetical protein